MLRVHAGLFLDTRVTPIDFRTLYTLPSARMFAVSAPSGGAQL